MHQTQQSPDFPRVGEPPGVVTHYDHLRAAASHLLASLPDGALEEAVSKLWETHRKAEKTG